MGAPETRKPSFFKEEIRKRSQNTLYHHFDENEAFNSFLQTVQKHENRKNRFSGLLRYAGIFVGLLSVGYGTYHFINPSETENNYHSKQCNHHIKIEREGVAAPSPI